MPSQYESMAMGVTMSIATSANLIGYFSIPSIMTRNDPNLTEAENDESNMKLAMYLNTIVAGGSLFFYIISSIPVYKLKK